MSLLPKKILRQGREVTNEILEHIKQVQQERKNITEAKQNLVTFT